MAEKLAEYRKRKERELYVQQQKQRMKSFFQKFFSRKPKKSPENQLTTEQTEKLLDSQPVLVEDVIEEEIVRQWTYLDWLYYILWFVFWVILYIIFIKLEFGLVYLISSGLVAMYFNTRTTPRRPGEASAYSVFNKDCESIDGTLKAEQFEKELIYGPISLS